MKKLVLSVFISVFFLGCASYNRTIPTNSGIVSLSEPVFIDNFPKVKLISVNFTNTSNYDIDLTNYVITRLQADGFNVVAKKDANIFIEGNINYIDKKTFSNNDGYARPRVRASVGFGFGSGFGRRSRHSSHFGFGLGFPLFAPIFYDDDDYYYNEYAYIGQVSLFIQIRDDKQNYVTNLDYKSVSNPGNFERVSESFKYKIYQQIKQILSR